MHPIELAVIGYDPETGVRKPGMVAKAIEQVTAAIERELETRLSLCAVRQGSGG